MSYVGWRKVLLYRDLNYQKLQDLSYILSENHGEDKKDWERVLYLQLNALVRD